MGRWARVDGLGLVVPPSQRDCFGGNCHISQATGKCFTDRHHLYFSRAKFGAEPLTSDFRESPENIVWMARCRHDTYHHDNEEAPMPPREVMAEFVQESRLIQALGATATNLQVKLAVYDQEVAKDPSRLEDEIFELNVRFIDLLAATQNITLINNRVEIPQVYALPDHELLIA